MVNKNFPDLVVGSRVFVYAAGALQEHKIKAFKISNYNGELRGYIETEVGEKGYPQKMSLDVFIKGIEAAQDMKISDITR